MVESLDPDSVAVRVLREALRWSRERGPSARLPLQALAESLGCEAGDAGLHRTVSDLQREGYLLAEELTGAGVYDAMIAGITDRGRRRIDEWRNRSRTALIQALFDSVDGSEHASVDLHDLGAEADLSKQDVEDIGRYLEEQSLIRFVTQSGLGGQIALTNRGIREVEASRRRPERPTEHLVPLQTIIHVEGDVINSPIQQASSNSQQSTTLNMTATDVRDVVRQVREALCDLSVDAGEREMIEASLARAEQSAGSSEPAAKRVVFASLRSVRAVVEGMVAIGGYEGLNHLLAVLPR